MKKQIHKVSLFILGLSLVFLSASCSKIAEEKKAEKTRLYVQTTGLDLSTDDGYYHMNSTGFLKFFDYKKEEEVFVCSRLHCKHEEWNESTPEEERCLAYLPGQTNGFVHNDKLYIIQSHLDEVNKIFVSNLDRSESKLLCEIDRGYVAYFVVRDNQLILTNMVHDMIRHEDGSRTMSNLNTAKLVSIDLLNGKTEVLIENQTGFNNVYRMLAANDSSIYLTYEYNKKYFDGTNFPEVGATQEFYKLDIESKEIIQILKQLPSNERMASTLGQGNQMLAMMMTYNDTGGPKEARLALLNLDTETLETIDKLEEDPTGWSIDLSFGHESAYYRSPGEAGWFEYRLSSQEKIHHPKMNLAHHFIFGDAKEYFYISKQEPGKNSVSGFLKKEEVYNGNMDGFIPVP